MNQTLVIRNPHPDDGAAIWTLVKNCHPLDLNSSYLYVLLCHHFKETCLVAEKGGEIAGFVSAYIMPQQQDTLFVWQIAVSKSLRGQGVSKRMLNALVKLDACRDIKFWQLSIAPSNKPSLRLFTSFAEELDLHMREHGAFEEEVLSHEGDHEREVLYRIGPLD
jgi:L-2,4-diaminobutyric acid acetyltransferase